MSFLSIFVKFFKNVVKSRDEYEEAIQMSKPIFGLNTRTFQTNQRDLLQSESQIASSADKVVQSILSSMEAGTDSSFEFFERVSKEIFSLSDRQRSASSLIAARANLDVSSGDLAESSFNQGDVVEDMIQDVLETNKRAPTTRSDLYPFPEGVRRPFPQMIEGLLQKTAPTFKKLSAQNRLDKPKNKQFLEKEDQKVLMKLYYRGKFQSEIAKNFGRSQSTISGWIAQLQENGLLQDRLESKKADQKILIDLYYQGKSQSEIAKNLGKAQCTISCWVAQLKKKGVLQDRLERKELEQNILEDLKVRFLAG